MRWSKVRYYLSEIFWCLRIFPWLATRAHKAVVVIEPWSIFLAVIGLGFSIYTFHTDNNYRKVESRLRAFEIILAPGPSNGGKVEAAHFLIDQGKDIEGAQLRSVLWPNIDLPDRSLRNITFDGANLQSANFEGSDLRHSNFVEANLNEANLKSSYLPRAKFRQASLVRSNLTHADAIQADFTDAVLYQAIAPLIRARDADFSNADLADGILVRAELNGSNFSNANLFASDLSGADLRDADFERADLLAANLSGSDLRDAKINQKQLKVACGDEKTRLSVGLLIAKCTEVEWFSAIHGPGRWEDRVKIDIIKSDLRRLKMQLTDQIR